MEKMVTVPLKVEDVMGLLIDLKKGGFSVLNVGSDLGNTYVYLDPSEEKDPTSVVESWVGKPAPLVSDRETWNKRGKEMAAFPPVQATSPEKRPSLLSRIFRKIMG